MYQKLGGSERAQGRETEAPSGVQRHSPGRECGGQSFTEAKKTVAEYWHKLCLRFNTVTIFVQFYFVLSISSLISNCCATSDSSN